MIVTSSAVLGKCPSDQLFGSFQLPETPVFQVFPVHMLLIADNGINIIENFFLEEIAAAKEYEFLLVVAPLKIRGGTGSALRSFALVP